MNLDAYDDMMGLEFSDYSDFEYINMEMIKEALIASSAGGGAILLATFGVKKITTALALETKVPDPLLRSGLISAATFLVGVAGGRALYEYNREAAMGVVGGLGGMAVANFLDALISKLTGGARMLNALGEDDSLSSYGAEDGMAALQALEATGVTSAPGAFHGFSDPSVTAEALMGLEAAVTQEETLGGYNAYMS